MNMKELVGQIADTGGLTKKESRKVLDTVLECVMDSLVENGEVNLGPGFGKITVKTQAERNGVNPKTGESLKIPEKKIPKFKASKRLKERVNQ